MRYWKILALPVLSLLMWSAAPKAEAQIAVSIGAPPICPYGYFDYAPYSCAPYGYYGPDWFSGGVFIGAGPWFHGAVPSRSAVSTEMRRGTDGVR